VSRYYVSPTPNERDGAGQTGKFWCFVTDGDSLAVVRHAISARRGRETCGAYQNQMPDSCSASASAASQLRTAAVRGAAGLRG